MSDDQGLERARGDCSRCEIALNFERGELEGRDLDDCVSCQRRTQLLAQLDKEGEEVSNQLEANRRWLEKRLRLA